MSAEQQHETPEQVIQRILAKMDREAAEKKSPKVIGSTSEKILARVIPLNFGYDTLRQWN